MSSIVLSWLLTYLLHSTLLLGGAWLTWRWLPREALALKEALWRTALLGGFFSRRAWPALVETWESVNQPPGDER